MSNYTILTADNLLEITDQLDDQTLLTYCQTNKEIADLCSHKVWLHRIYSNNLVPLLRYAVLYPSLREFYLNIRHDAIYELWMNYIENGTNKRFLNYYVNVKDVYDAIQIPRQTTYRELILRMNNKKYNISYKSNYTPSKQYKKAAPLVTSFQEILKFPDLEPRRLTITNIDDISHVAASDLRDLRKMYDQFVAEHVGPVMNYLDFIVHSVGPVNDINATFIKFRFGFYECLTGARNKLLVLLDGSLVNSTNPTNPTDSNYYVVVAPQPVENRRQILNGLSHLIDIGSVDDPPVLLKYLEEYGTYYKLEDLAHLIRENN